MKRNIFAKYRHASGRARDKEHVLFAGREISVALQAPKHDQTVRTSVEHLVWYSKSPLRLGVNDDLAVTS